MNLAEEAYRNMYPDSDVSYEFEIQYSGRFKGYNANARRSGNKVIFSLSREWLEVDNTIVIGLLQHLIPRILRRKPKATKETEIYDLFIKSLSLFAPVTKTETILEQSFRRVNERFFDGIISQPNLVFGADSRRTFGTYDYHTDTIRISRLLEDPQMQDVLDYVMYHEMLHKHLSFESSEGRSRFHTSSFRRYEKKFPNHEEIENKLKRIASGRRRKPDMLKNIMKAF